MTGLGWAVIGSEGQTRPNEFSGVWSVRGQPQLIHVNQFATTTTLSIASRLLFLPSLPINALRLLMTSAAAIAAYVLPPRHKRSALPVAYEASPSQSHLYHCRPAAGSSHRAHLFVRRKDRLG
jgi:hypothetical protein